MCTAVTYKTKDCYFGRTLDYEFSYGEEFVIVPRNYVFNFKFLEQKKSNYAIMGVAHVYNESPLFYEAVNEFGLGIAGLNFVGNAHYNEFIDGKNNILTHEFIPWILSSSKTVEDAIEMINSINFVNQAISKDFPIAELHWIIADKKKSITVEAVKDGIKIYDNPVGILTNNPPFDFQMFSLNNYMNISNCDTQNKFSDKIKLNKYSRGMGAIGLPGDLSSQSRFVRAAFVKLNSISNDDELSSVNQYFHIMNSVLQQRGCCNLENDKYEITIYTSCYNLDQSIFYYTTYDNHQISSIEMKKENIFGDKLIKYPLIFEERINKQN